MKKLGHISLILAVAGFGVDLFLGAGSIVFYALIGQLLFPLLFFIGIIWFADAAPLCLCVINAFTEKRGAKPRRGMVIAQLIVCSLAVLLQIGLFKIVVKMALMIFLGLGFSLGGLIGTALILAFALGILLCAIGVTINTVRRVQLIWEENRRKNLASPPVQPQNATAYTANHLPQTPRFCSSCGRVTPHENGICVFCQKPF